MKLRYTLRAVAELEEILTHIKQSSPNGARHLEERIQTVIDLLLQYPYAGQATSNGRLRRLIATPYPYLIFYEIADDGIIIHGVRHASRQQ